MFNKTNCKYRQFDRIPRISAFTWRDKNKSLSKVNLEATMSPIFPSFYVISPV